MITGRLKFSRLLLRAAVVEKVQKEEREGNRLIVKGKRFLALATEMPIAQLEAPILALQAQEVKTL